MGRLVTKIVGFLLTAAVTIAFLALVYFGWFNWFLAGFLIFISIVFGSAGLMVMRHPDRFFTNPWEPIPTRKKRVLTAVTFFSVMIALLAISVLLALGIF